MVSVIIPVYEVSDYVERCIRSVIGQSYSDIECIIVDDATKDDSIVKCERLIEEYDGPIRFRVLHHEVNRGLSAARNTGTEEATGEWIYYLDSDDEITPDCLEKLMSIAQEHPDAEMVLSNTLKHFENGRVEQFINSDIPIVLLTNAEVFKTYQHNKLLVHAWNKLIKRSFLCQNQLFFKESIIYEDRLWMFFVVKVLSRLYICKDITYHYYLRSNSIVTSSEKHTVGTSFNIIYTEILNHLTLGREKEELSFYVEGFCRHYLEHKESMPNYKVLMKRYKTLSLKHACFSVYLKLCVTSFLGVVPIGERVLCFLQTIKLKVASSTSFVRK